jgi:hypothetical protein
MYANMRKMFWWKDMKKDIVGHVARCDICNRVRAEHQRPAGLLKPLDVPMWKWECISMDFIVGLPRSPKGHDSIWVIVDRLTKVAHFVPVKVDYHVEKLADLYIEHILRLLGHLLALYLIEEHNGHLGSGRVCTSRSALVLTIAPLITLRQMGRQRE